MKKVVSIMGVVLFLFFLAGCFGASEEKEELEIIVSAAASLTDALHEVKASFEEEHSHIKVTFNFGGSGSLQQQILQGAPVDIFFSAAEDRFEELVEEGFVAEGSRVDLVGNELVLIVPQGSSLAIASFEDLVEEATIMAIGQPDSVPAGLYARELLAGLGIWQQIEGDIVFANDVRQVLTYVETGNVDAGIVYQTDALLSTKVEVVAIAEQGSHTPIIYPLGILKDSSDVEGVKLFYDYMQSQESLVIFEEYGFSILR